MSVFTDLTDRIAHDRAKWWKVFARMHRVDRNMICQSADRLARSRELLARTRKAASSVDPVLAPPQRTRR
jgi:hypothetical protein